MTVYVELDGDPLARPIAVAAAAGPVLLGARVPDARARATQLQARQAELQARLPALGARVTGRFTRVANALRVQLPEDHLPQLGTLPGVRRVQPVRTYTRHLGVSVPFTGVPSVWSSAGGGIDGRGLRVGIIDSGIDYTHADFGGSGKVADFAANDPTRIEPGTFPTAKVVGGFDFAGDDYNPNEDAHETPVPDPDPLDCAANGHGTHVAGIAAGFGVLAGGTTYTGGYSADLDLAGFAIAPGVAPRALLYALKVFGCEGSTTLVTDALEWAADPNGDYDFSDRLDVVNLSLGGSFGALDPEDTDVAAANRLAELGCVVVCSAGNNENIFYAVGAPGVASRALSVANSISKGSGKALQVTSPPSIAGSFYLVEGAITPALTNTGPVSGRLVYIQPNIACDPPTNAAELRGHIALIDRGTCFFADKIRRAQDAGALAVVMVNNQDTAPIPMGGDSEGLRIPSGMISKADGAVLKAKLGETITVVLDAKNTIERPEFVDTLDDGSSRGPGSPGGRLKPEISAPGVNVFSAKAGAGTEGIAQTGTSMSAPLVTGAATLLRQLHPDWSVEDLKAALMNTARPIANHLGVPYPESRMGAGRVRVAEAAATTLTAAVEPEPEPEPGSESEPGSGAAASPAGEVGVSFGSLVLAAPYQATRTVRVRNHGDQPVTLRIAFSNSVVQAGIEFRPVDATLTVPARGSATTAVRLIANPAAFDPVPDATTAAEIGAGTILPRHFLYEASGQIGFVPVDSARAPIHVPCYATARAAADFAATSSRLVLSGATSTNATPEVALRFRGTAVSTNQFPLVTVLQLGDTSPDKHLADPNRAAADLLAVGAASDIASVDSLEDATVFFGLATSGPWSTPQPYIADFNILVDVTLDGWEDFVVTNGNGASTNTSGAQDAFMTVVYALDRDFTILSTNAVAFLNHYAADEADTAVFNNSVLVLPVPAAALGLSPRFPDFRYKVTSVVASGSVDRTGWIPFDAARPVIDTAFASPDGSPVHDDGLPITVRLDREAARESGQRLPGILLLHHHGRPDRRAEIVTLDLAHDDTDQDTLPDWWEQQHFGGIAAAGRNTDFDGDGSPDAHELIAGTDPADAKSAFRMLSATRVSSRGISVRWSGIAGQVFTLERSTNLAAGFTETVRDDIESTPPMNSITDNGASGPGPYFYRVRLK